MQPYSIEAVSPGPSNAVRAHDHPMLESGNLSFPQGRYVLEFQPGEDRSSYTITHRVQGAALISRLLDARQARFVCIVSSPISSYRRTHVSEKPQHEVRWNTEELGEPPMFTPMIVCSEPQEITLSANRDGVHTIWDNQRVTLDKGSRLVLGSVIRLESSILHLLSLHEAGHLKDGQFVVEIETEPFRFRVNVSTDLHRFLRYRSDENRSNIMTHIVTACLARLQHDTRGRRRGFGMAIAPQPEGVRGVPRAERTGTLERPRLPARASRNRPVSACTAEERFDRRRGG